MPLSITEAKKIFSTELGKNSPPEPKTAFLSIISTSKKIQSGKDISQLAKAALLIFHSDKQGNQHADELTKKLTAIMTDTQTKSLQDAQTIVKTQFQSSPLSADSDKCFEKNCKKMMKLLKLIELGDKLELPSVEATTFFEDTMSGDAIKTKDLGENIKFHVQALDKAIKAKLGTLLETLPKTMDNTKALYNELGRLKQNSMSKTSDISDLYDGIKQIQYIERVFDQIDKDKGIPEGAKAIAREFRDEWTNNTRKLDLKEATDFKDMLTQNSQGRPGFVKDSENIDPNLVSTCSQEHKRKKV